MFKRLQPFALFPLLSLSHLAFAGDAISGAAEQQATNWPAIIIFLIFVAFTLAITVWSSRRTRSAADYYAAGGGITGFQNGLAIAGDYMSAASFLGISGLVYLSGFDGLIYSIGFMVAGVSTINPCFARGFYFHLKS